MNNVNKFYADYEFDLQKAVWIFDWKKESTLNLSGKHLKNFSDIVVSKCELEHRGKKNKHPLFESKKNSLHNRSQLIYIHKINDFQTTFSNKFSYRVPWYLVDSIKN